MTNSLELYKETLTFAKNNPAAQNFYVLRNFYLQLVTMTFYELTAKKNSPLISLLCQMNCADFAPKNFKVTPQQPFNLPTDFDMYMIVDGLNYAFSDGLDSSMKILEPYKENIFRGLSLNENYLQELIKILSKLDGNLGKIFPVDVDADKNFLQGLIQARHADDEKIIGEIKEVQRALQDELPRLQSTLKKISDIRDGLEFKAAQEPINQLIQLFDKVNETLQTHPKPDPQKGYETLLKRCRNFSRFVEQSLGMLGAQLINEINIPVDFGKHEVTNIARPPDSAKVSKILRVGLIYKGQVIRKAEVEVNKNFFGR